MTYWLYKKYLKRIFNFYIFIKKPIPMPENASETAKDLLTKLLEKDVNIKNYQFLLK